jgi:crooked neck
VPGDDDTGADEDRPVSKEAKARARKVFQRAHELFKNKDMKEERADLLNAWKSFEQTHGSTDDVENIDKQIPRKERKRRKIEEDRFEEYIDYVFPADDKASANMSNLLKMAQAWKQQQQITNGSNGNQE